MKVKQTQKPLSSAPLVTVITSVQVFSRSVLASSSILQTSCRNSANSSLETGASLSKHFVIATDAALFLEAE